MARALSGYCGGERFHREAGTPFFFGGGVLRRNTKLQGVFTKDEARAGYCRFIDSTGRRQLRRDWQKKTSKKGAKMRGLAAFLAPATLARPSGGKKSEPAILFFSQFILGFSHKASKPNPGFKCLRGDRGP